MDWSNERYVRLYVRDTVGWIAKSWQARALLTFMIRKADRSGVIDAGGHGLRGLAALVSMPELEVVKAMPELISDGTVVATESAYVIPNYLAAQEAIASDAQRARDHRERRRAKSLGSEGSAVAVPEPREPKTDHPPKVTFRDGTPGVASRNVTERAENVTPVQSSPSDPSVLSLPGTDSTDSTDRDDIDFSRLFARLPRGLKPAEGDREESETAMREIHELGADLDVEIAAFVKRNKGKAIAPARRDTWLAGFLRQFNPEKAAAKRERSEAKKTRKPAKSTKTEKANAEGREFQIGDSLPESWYVGNYFLEHHGERLRTTYLIVDKVVRDRKHAAPAAMTAVPLLSCGLPPGAESWLGGGKWERFIAMSDVGALNWFAEKTAAANKAPAGRARDRALQEITIHRERWERESRRLAEGAA